MTYFEFKGKKLAYTYQGEGSTIVLLHGYLETKEVWTDFATALAKKHRVITIDIPGHGNSETLQQTHHMCLMAEAIESLLSNLQIETCVMVGHSMGGYVALCYAEYYAHRLTGFTLFHSSIYADTEEKRNNRRREIEFVMSGKKDLILNTNLPNMFADENVARFETDLERIKKHAQKHTAEGISALLRGMMERQDRQELVKNFNKPMLFIFGKKDNYIPVEAAQKMIEVNPKIKVEWLKNSGHMGFIEEFEKSLEIIIEFVLLAHREN